MIAAWSALVIGGLYMLAGHPEYFTRFRGEIGTKRPMQSRWWQPHLACFWRCCWCLVLHQNLLTKRINGEVEKIVRLAKPEGAAPKKWRL